MHNKIITKIIYMEIFALKCKFFVIISHILLTNPNSQLSHSLRIHKYIGTLITYLC